MRSVLSIIVLALWLAAGGCSPPTNSKSAAETDRGVKSTSDAERPENPDAASSVESPKISLAPRDPNGKASKFRPPKNKQYPVKEMVYGDGTGADDVLPQLLDQLDAHKFEQSPDFYLKRLQHEQGYARLKTVQAIDKWLQDEESRYKKEHPRLIDGLLESAKNDADSRVRVAAIEAMARNKRNDRQTRQLQALLSELTASPNDRIRAAALNGLNVLDPGHFAGQEDLLRQSLLLAKDTLNGDLANLAMNFSQRSLEDRGKSMQATVLELIEMGANNFEFGQRFLFSAFQFIGGNDANDLLAAFEKHKKDADLMEIYLESAFMIEGQVDPSAKKRIAISFVEIIVTLDEPAANRALNYLPRILNRQWLSDPEFLAVLETAKPRLDYLAKNSKYNQVQARGLLEMLEKN